MYTFGGYHKWNCCEHSHTNLSEKRYFELFGKISKSKPSETYGKYKLNFSRNCQQVSQNDWTSPQEWIRIPVVPYSQIYLGLSDFNFSNLMGDISLYFFTFPYWLVHD